jgi:hypothetical protein
MPRILLGDKELEVAEDFDEILSRINIAQGQGPTIAGVRVLPSGWILVRAVEFGGEEIPIQTSAISYVRQGAA